MQGPWLFGTVALVLVGLAGYLIGTLLERRRADAAARLARHDAACQAQLREVWSWSTDSRHQLQRLQPPAGAADAAWVAGPAGLPVWEHFDIPPPPGAPPTTGGRPGGLRARLDAQLPFAGLRVLQAADDSVWQLRAAPRLDADGRFAGFEGTALPMAEADALRADQDALQTLLAALDAPALLAVDDGHGWQLRHANAAASQLIGVEPPAALLPALPAGLRAAVAQADVPPPHPLPQGAAAAEPEGWLMRRWDSGTDRGLLLLQRTAAAGVAASDGSQNDENASFSFTLSHDLRAPIRVVEGFTRIVKEDYSSALDRVGNDHLDRVLGAAARMNQMIDALLTLARLSQQPLARQPVNLSQLATFVADDLKRAAPERSAEISIEPGLQASGDPTLLRLVLENLLGNAWKYTARCKKASIVFGCEMQQGRRTFVVRDNGAGFDMRGADRLFGLFQRLHSANDFPGTGVGLASVKRIVRRHGGDVWADAEPGRGAAFHFTLRD